MNTGEAIGILAKEKGFNLRQLAVKAEVPYNTLYAIVKRKSSRIDGRTLSRIASALEVSIEDLEPFTPKVMHLGANEGWVVNSRFEGIVTTRMVDADTREARKAAKEDAIRLLKSFDLLDSEGQKKAIELIDLLTKVPEYRNPAAENRKTPKGIAREIIEERVDIRRANKEAILYDMIEQLLIAYDARAKELQFAWIEELIVEHEAGKRLEKEEFLALVEVILNLVEAYDKGDEDEVHRLIAEFVDTAAYDRLEGAKTTPGNAEDSAEEADKPQNAS